MINTLFFEQLKKYKPSDINQIKNAMKEVLQDIILSGLAKSEFFQHAAFYGGTSLRIFRGLPRFSEDLDFTLIEKVSNFVFDEYLVFVRKELEILRVNFEINTKEKSASTSVVSSFVIFNLKELFEISFKEYADKIIKNEVLSIKVEVETNYLEGGQTENKLLTYPSFVQIRTFTMDTLFASKLLAVLGRKWKTRSKGRDFYDYLFYLSCNTSINLVFLENGLKKSGLLNDGEELTIARLKEELIKKFNSVDFQECVKDVYPFVKNEDPYISAFTKEIFVSTVDLIK